jgi:hypothetical protein
MPRPAVGGALVGVLAVAGCAGSGGSAAQARPVVICAAIDRLDPAPLLGSVQQHRPCRADDASGSLGLAVWTAASGLRLSVSVIDNGNTEPDGASATFEQLYTQAPASMRCTATATDTGERLRCLDKTNTGEAQTGTFILDEGTTYLVVWMSDEDGQSAGIEIGPAQRPAFMTFVAAAAKAIYGSPIQLPDTSPPTGPSPGT